MGTTIPNPRHGARSRILGAEASRKPEDQAAAEDSRAQTAPEFPRLPPPLPSAFFPPPEPEAAGPNRAAPNKALPKLGLFRRGILPAPYMAFPGRCLLLPGFLPPLWSLAGSPNARKSGGRPGGEGSGAENWEHLGSGGFPAGTGLGKPGPWRGRGRVGPGFCRRHPMPARPPLGPWERGGSEGEERLGWRGQRPPRRGGALTSCLDQRLGAFPSVTGETEARK